MHPLLAAYLDNLWNRLNGGVNGWTILGLFANAVFSSRFFVQWYVSEKQKRSVIPVSFWWLSMGGSLLLTVYAIHLGAVPIILGTLPPMFIYARNLILIARGKRGLAADDGDEPTPQGRPTPPLPAARAGAGAAAAPAEAGR